MTEQLTLLPEDTLASRSALPGSEKARMMTATSGQLCLASSKNTGPLGLLEKMLLGISAWASTVCFLTWRVQITPQGHLLFRLVPSTPRIEGIDAGLLLTPRAKESGEKQETFLKRMGDRSEKCHSSLTAQLRKLYPTVARSDAKGSSKNRYNGSPESHGNLREVLRDGPEDGQYPHPEFIEWLMGFPIGWTEIQHLETPLSPKSPKS